MKTTYSVTLKRDGLPTQRYGTYETRDEAERVAAMHRQGGYWRTITVDQKTSGR
jgi:hypothetical protein